MLAAPVAGSVPPAGAPADADADEFRRILASLDGMPVVVNYWASWCAPCRSEMPILVAAAVELEGSVAFLGVASEDRREDADEFIREFAVPYPNLLDADGSIGALVDLVGLPATLIVGRDGRLVARHDGVLTEDRLEELLAAVS
ncbi:MAG: TlpA disulfide reductase family protein [Acidimicrobiales bacterium]|nr:TlpA disulfide reductase family protein [Acidimicrobiales bacterium]